MNDPLVSIIIPVYNVEKYLSQCLESVINQTYSNLEIIVVNDGSPDNSYVIIENFKKKDARIKSIDQKNAGLSAARNAGIELSLGEYMMFVDSDDWIDIDMVDNLVSKMSASVDLVVCSYKRMYADKALPRLYNIEGLYEANYYQRRLLGLIEKELFDPSQTDTFSIACGKLYKGNLIRDNKIQFLSTKEIGTEDLLFNIQYSNFITSCFIVNQPYYNYRRDNENSLTSTFKPKLFNQWLNLYSIIGKLVGNKNITINNAFNNRICLSIIGLGLNEMQNPAGFSSRYSNLKKILNHNLYKQAYSKLELKYFPFHWKLFFIFAKYRFIIGVYVMVLGISYAVNKNN